MVAEKYLIRMTTDHNDNLVRDGYFVSFASFPFGSRETSGSKFGMIFNPCLKESQCKTVCKNPRHCHPELENVTDMTDISV